MQLHATLADAYANDALTVSKSVCSGYAAKRIRIVMAIPVYTRIVESIKERLTAVF